MPRETTTIAAKALTVWAGILILAVGNGLFREMVLTPKLGKTPGLVLSGVLLSGLIVGISYVALPWLRVRRAGGLFAIGLGWLVLTVLFEFAFGLLQGKGWAVLLEAYTFKGGNIWPVVLLVTALAPCLAAKLRGWL